MTTFGNVFDSYLNETHPPVLLLGIEYSPSRVLKLVDAAAYRSAFNDWIDGLECHACATGQFDATDRDEWRESCDTCHTC